MKLEGRRWFFYDENGWGGGHRLSVEWYLLWRARSCGISINFNGCEDAGLLLHLAIPFLFDVYLGLTFAWINRRMPTKPYRRADGTVVDLPEERECSLRIHSGCLWWGWWKRPDEWRFDDPWWMHGHFDPAKFFLGDTKHWREQEAPVAGTIRLPEGSYNFKGSTYIGVWKRPRWFAQRQRMYQVNFDPPLPIPGKGTQAWNCDDDCTYSCSGPAESIEAFLQKQTRWTLERRDQYGGKEWAPRDGWPVPVEEDAG